MPLFPYERAVKLKVAKLSDARTFIIGSSRAAQFSTQNFIASSHEVTNGIHNLCVSGATFEDYVVMTGALLQKDIDNIIYVIDPWVFKKDMDDRWKYYRRQYYCYEKRMGIDKKLNCRVDKSHQRKAVLNKGSINTIFNLLIDDYKILVNAKKFLKPVKNLKKPILILGKERSTVLRDGSLIYPDSYIKHIKKKPLGNGSYKIQGKPFEESVVNGFSQMIKEVQKKGVNIYFILSPYNPAVFQQENSKIYSHINKVEKKIIELAELNHIKYFGSYNPNNITKEIEKDDFTDDFHPTRNILNKMKLILND